jgi:hypothetical protein
MLLIVPPRFIGRKVGINEKVHDLTGLGLCGISAFGRG